jgi:hypothetical protein
MTAFNSEVLAEGFNNIIFRYEEFYCAGTPAQGQIASLGLQGTTFGNSLLLDCDKHTVPTVLACPFGAVLTGFYGSENNGLQRITRLGAFCRQGEQGCSCMHFTSAPCI